MWKWLDKHMLDIVAWGFFVAGVIFGGVDALMYGLGLGNRAQNMEKARECAGIFAICAGTAVFIFLCNFLLNRLYAWGEKKFGRLEKYTDPERFPKPEDRKLQKLLAAFSQKVLLIVWDVLQGCAFFSFLLVLPMVLEEQSSKKMELFLTMIVWLAYIVGIHFLIFLYYKKRDYTGKLLKYTEKYMGAVDREFFLKDLEQDLQAHMLVYLEMWILTENYMIGWGETEMAFCPVAIPRAQIAGIRFRVSNKWFGRGKRSICPVIICDLKNGKTVELFAGNRYQIEVVQELLTRFCLM